MSEFPISGKVDMKVGERSVDKLIDAVVDTFSPATETLGALGDAVRLARVGMAARITRRAKEIGDENGLTLTAPPLKFLVPLYEKASLEDESDEALIEMWAALLANAGSGEAEPSPLFSDAISKLSPKAAGLFENFCEAVSLPVSLRPIMQSQKLSEAVNDTFQRARSNRIEELSPYRHAGSLPYLISNVKFEDNPEYPDILERMEGKETPSGVSAQVSVSSTKAFDWGFAGGESHFPELSQLVSLGLLREFSFDRELFDPEVGLLVVRTTLSGFSLTPFGASLFKATRVFQDQ